MADTVVEPLDRLSAVYVSHKEAPLEAIGALERSIDEAQDFGYCSRVVLATCNRMEVYLDDSDGSCTGKVVELYTGKGVRPRVASGLEAARRIMRIAAGLESAVIGEPEILGQVRSAWISHRDKGLTTPLLDRVFHAAIVAGKKARRETGIGQGSASYISAAVKAAARELNGLTGRTVAVMGAGSAGGKLVRILCSTHSPSVIYVVSRSLERASRIAGLCPQGAPLILEDGLKDVAPLDAVFIAVKGYEKARVEGVARRARVVIDLSNPPVADPSWGRVLLLDDLRGIVEEAIRLRSRWIPAVEHIIEDELERLTRRLSSERIGEAIKLLEEYTHRLIEEFSEGNGDRLLLTRFSGKLLHGVYMGLRRASSSPGSCMDELLGALKEYYGGGSG